LFCLVTFFSPVKHKAHPITHAKTAKGNMTNLTALILLDMAHPISECSQTGNKCCCELHFTTLSIPMTRVKNAGLTFEKEGGYFSEAEAVDWDHAIEKYAKDGWRVNKCETIVYGEDIIFWALLEKS